MSIDHGYYLNMGDVNTTENHVAGATMTAPNKFEVHVPQIMASVPVVLPVNDPTLTIEDISRDIVLILDNRYVVPFKVPVAMHDLYSHTLLGEVTKIGLGVEMVKKGILSLDNIGAFVQSFITVSELIKEVSMYKISWENLSKLVEAYMDGRSDVTFEIENGDVGEINEILRKRPYFALDIFELVRNAYKVRATEIKVKAKILDGGIWIAVSDNGNGFVDKESIQVAFSRGFSTTGSTGLGLAIFLEHVVERNGELHVTNKGENTYSIDATNGDVSESIDTAGKPDGDDGLTTIEAFIPFEYRNHY
jgi:signal transduction histidine kinase